MRRGLFVDYLDIVGPFNPSTARPESYTKIFICGQKTDAVRADDSEQADGARVPAPGDAGGDCSRSSSSCGSRSAKAIRSTKGSAWRFRRFSHRPTSSSASKRIRRPRAELQSADAERVRAHAGAQGRGYAAPRVEEYPVSDIELASRLSYFLWASMPDAELMRVAKAGTLRQPAVLEAQVRRMMADPKGFNLVENWAAQWLQLRNLGRTKPDPEAVSNGRRRAPRCDAQRDDDVRRRHH